MGKNDSTSTQTSNFQIDASIEDRSLNLEEVSDANISTVEGIGNTIINNSVDDAVLAATLDGAGAITDDVLEYSAGVTQASNDIVVAAGGAVLTAADSALQYGAGATQSSLEFAGQAGDKALSTVFAAGQVVADDADAQREFAAGAIQESNKLASKSIAEVSSAYARANQVAGASIDSAFDFGEMAFNKSLNAVTDAGDDALAFGAGAFDSAINAVLESTYLTTNKLANATTETINTVSKAATSENQQSLDKVIKLAGVVMGGLALISVLPRFIKS